MSRAWGRATNGDGVGVGWYGEHAAPGLYRSIEPAWGDRNLRELAAPGQVGAVPGARAGVDRHGGAADQLPSVPPWPVAVDAQRLDPGLRAIKRDLRFAVDVSLYDELAGSTDSELFFFLALTLRPDHDPPAPCPSGRLIESGTARQG